MCFDSVKEVAEIISPSPVVAEDLRPACVSVVFSCFCVRYGTEVDVWCLGVLCYELAVSELVKAVVHSHVLQRTSQQFKNYISLKTILMLGRLEAPRSVMNRIKDEG